MVDAGKYLERMFMSAGEKDRRTQTREHLIEDVMKEAVRGRAHVLHEGTGTIEQEPEAERLPERHQSAVNPS